MKQDRWRQVDELFEAALRRDKDERAAFLEKACAGDSNLRREVEKMLKFDEQAKDFIETPVFDVATELMTEAPVAPRVSEAFIETKKKRTPGTSLTTDSIDEARFIPGDVLADRYRIAGLLGRGGMGEVYRADDLKLKQSVALKFLPERLSDDAVALARFYKEVSVARGISHRHVCRVYDIGEADGFHFISMEFVRGEELASLLKRIGRLPQDKAVEIARQLCAGLAAIHEKGVLHRDLKPANIMIDEHGDVRITDFGIAALAEATREGDPIAGTPAYMSPEQLEGKELTIRSDIYSLGLVLYEIFTGKRAFEAGSLAELISLRKSDTQPSSPSQHVANLDPLVERVIFRCLERDPNARPQSALSVAAALPGGDPLQAALAAGEMPSPEMVAAAPKKGSLRPSVAVSLLASVIVGLALIILLSGQVALHRIVPLKKTPEGLGERAVEIAKRFGYNTAPADTAYGFSPDFEYLIYAHNNDQSLASKSVLETGQPSAISFWYRQSPHYIEPYSGSQITMTDPPNNVPGMIQMMLDTTGRLVYFEAVPAREIAKTEGAQEPPDWSMLFQAAGFDQAAFQPMEPKWNPSQNSDVRAAWQGSYPNRPEIPIRIEAASYHGRPVYFEIVTPWRRPSQQTPYDEGAASKAGSALMLIFYFGALVLGAVLAWRNLRLGRGDRKGAFRVALFIFGIRMVYWVFNTHHVPTTGEVVNLLISGLQSALFWACLIGLMYLALEPFLRRRWPEWIISWSRLLAGDFRDPLVGRDILIGAVFGVGLMLASYLTKLVPEWLGHPMELPAIGSSLIYTRGLLGPWGFLQLLINQISASLLFTFIVTFLLLFLSMLLRRNRLGIVAGWLLIAILAILISDDKSPVSLLLTLLTPTLIVVAVARFGLLTLISAIFFLHLTAFYPVTTELSAWYASSFILDLVILMTLAFYGFYSSMAGQQLFRAGFLDD